MGTILLFIYLFNLYVRPQDWLPVLYGWPVDYLIIIPALLIALLAKGAEGKRLANIPQYKLIAALLAIVFLSNAANGYFVFGIQEFIYCAKKAAIFVLVLLVVKSAKSLKNAMFFIVMLSAFIAIQGISQYLIGGFGFAGQDFYHSGEGLRTTWVGLWNGANVTALLLNIAVPFALEFGFGPYPQIQRIISLALGAALIWGVYTTNSRGGFVTLIAILFLYPLLRLKKKKIAIIIGILFAAFTVIYFAPSRMGELSTDEESAHIRTRLWGNAMDMFKKSPLLGIGKGRFIEDDENWRHMMAHSNFMQNLGETGGIGIFVWMALIYFSVKGLYQISKWKPTPGTKEDLLKSLSRALIVSMLGFNICTLFVTMDIDIFYLLLGLCAAAINIAHREIKPVRMRFTFKDVRNVCAIIVLLLLFYHMYTR